MTAPIQERAARTLEQIAHELSQPSAFAENERQRVVDFKHQLRNWGEEVGFDELRAMVDEAQRNSERARLEDARTNQAIDDYLESGCW